LEEMVAPLRIKLTVGLCAFVVSPLSLVLPVNVQAKSLSFTEVDAHTIACMFNKKCKLPSQNTAESIPLPVAISGKALLRTRTFRGAPGSPAMGKRGYQYQVDLTGVTSLADAPCITGLALDFGDIVPLKYGSTGSKEDVYVIAHGEPQAIGLFAAEAGDGRVSFTFREPVCAGINAGAGRASYSVGLTSARPPKSIKAIVRLPGRPTVTVAVRAPGH
jgi:hypothetical protein